TSRAFQQNSEVLLLGRTKAKSVDLFQRAGTFQVNDSDDISGFSPCDPVSGLKQSQRKSRRSPAALGNLWKRFWFDFPAKRSGSHPGDAVKVIRLVKLESQYEPHPVTERLEQLVLVRGSEQQREILQRNGDRR